MKEYRIDIKIRNNIILSKIENIYKISVKKFCENFKVCYHTLCRLLSMQTSPFSTITGEFRPIVLKLADLLSCAPEDLFSESQMHALLKNNKKVMEVSKLIREIL